MSKKRELSTMQQINRNFRRLQIWLVILAISLGVLAVLKLVLLIARLAGYTEGE